MFLLSVFDLNVFVGTTIDQVKNGVAAPYLQIREGLGANRALKSKVRRKRKGDTRQCQTGMICRIILFTFEVILIHVKFLVVDYKNTSQV